MEAESTRSARGAGTESAGAIDWAGFPGASPRGEGHEQALTRLVGQGLLETRRGARDGPGVARGDGGKSTGEGEHVCG